jgi:integration host factor subunit beta
MTRSELIAALSAEFAKLPPQEIDAAVRVLLKTMSETLARGGRIEIRGFGSFSLHRRPPRLGRNPKTGEVVAVPAKWAPHFKPGKSLRERVDAARR